MSKDLKSIKERFQEMDKSLEYFVSVLTEDEIIKQSNESDMMKMLNLKMLKEIGEELHEMRMDIVEISEMVLRLDNIDKLHKIVNDKIRQIIGER